MTRFRSITALLLAATLVFAACGDDDTDQAASGATSDTTSSETTGDTADGAGDEGTGDAGTSGAGDTIDIVDFEFMPMELTTEAGADITLTNADGTAHTATADSGEFDSDSVAGGEEGTFSAPDEAGSYSYYCKFHPFMKGTLVVE